jgi:hypothetical protein
MVSVTTRVHFADVRTALQQLAVDALLVLQRQAVARQGQQRRAAARDQAQNQIVLGQPLREREDALRGLETGRVGHRVRGLDHLDALRQARGPRRRVAVARDHQARERRVFGPQRFDRLRHRATGLAGAEHQGVVFGRPRQVRGGVVQRQRALNGHVVQVAQQGARVIEAGDGGGVDHGGSLLIRSP